MCTIVEEQDTCTEDKGLEPRFAAAEGYQGLANGLSALVDRARSTDEGARLFWMQRAVMVDTKAFRSHFGSGFVAVAPWTSMQQVCWRIPIQFG